MKKICSIILIVAVLLVGTVFIFNLSYPVKYKNEVEKQAKKYGIDKYLVYAVIKCESSFKADIVSDKGARGLMQLMPQTAEFIANKIGYKNYDLFNPKDNIALGVAYLGYLCDKFGEKVALYAYNAGEGRVKKYLDGGGDLNVFPYQETVSYVKRVLKAKKNYIRLGNLPCW